MEANETNTETTTKSPLGTVISTLVGLALLGGAAYFILAPAPEEEAAQRPNADPPVLVHQVEETVWEETVEALGNVLANEQAMLSPKVVDRVTAVHFESGQQVTEGLLLIELNDAEQRAQLAEMEAALDERSRQLERVRSVENSGALSRSVIDEEISRYNVARAQLELAQARLDDRRILAPFDGVVGLRDVSPGELVEVGDPLVTIIDLTPVKVDFTIAERYFAQVQPGLMIQARAEAYPDRVFTGEVQSVSPQIDPISRAALVRAIVPNEDYALRPGMLLNVQLNLGERRSLTIPESALNPIGDQQYVYRVNAEGVAEQTAVTVGRRQKGVVEIVEGLKVGESVVTHGHRVRPGQPVNILTEDQVFSGPRES